jgi:hypothetical protein
MLQRVQLWCPVSSLERGLDAIVCSHQNYFHQSTASNAEHRECYHQQHGLDIPWFFASGEEIWAPDSSVSIQSISFPSHRSFLNNLPYIARLSQDVDDSRCASSFLRRLTGRACSPCEYKTVTSEAACNVQEAGEVSSGNVEGRDRNDEACDRYAHRYDDMPATLAEPIAVVRHGECDESTNEIGRCGTDEGDGVGA